MHLPASFICKVYRDQILHSGMSSWEFWRRHRIKNKFWRYKCIFLLIYFNRDEEPIEIWSIERRHRKKNRMIFGNGDFVGTVNKNLNTNIACPLFTCSAIFRLCNILNCLILLINMRPELFKDCFAKWKIPHLKFKIYPQLMGTKEGSS